MKKPFIHLIVLLSMAMPLFAQDTVFFKNGDVLSGVILKQKEGRVYFKSPAFGSVSLSSRDIERLSYGSDLPIETPTFEDLMEAMQETAKPAMTPSPEEPVQLAEKKLPATPKAEKVASAEVKPPTAIKKKKDRWTGKTGISVAMRESTKSNNKGVISQEKYKTYNLYGNVDWKGEKDALRWDLIYRYSKNEVSKRDDFFNVTQKYSHDFQNNYFATTKTLYQRDYKRKIENEYLQTAEIGIKWFDTPKLKFYTSAGGGYHAYDRTSNAAGYVSVSQGKFILDQSLRWQLINSLTLIQKYTHLGDLTDYHSVFSAGLENKLINDVFLRLEYRMDKDTEIYYNDRGYDDKALLTSLLYKF